MFLFKRKKEEQDKKKSDDKPAKQVSEKKPSMKELYLGKKGETAKESEKEKTVKKQSAKKDGNAYRILVKPLITEKAANLGTSGKYVFEVDCAANKIEIAKAINEIYGVKPIGVNVIKMQGKRKRHGRIFGRRKNWKKAIVSLPKGKTINIYEGV